MISKKIKAVSFVATMGLFASAVYAEQESQIQRLGADLTPLGAVKSGSEDGRIPDWTGGLPVDAAPVNNGFMSNPFPDDEPLFTITASNYQEYEENLSEGQVAMLENYPDTYKIPVYESRRTAAVPDDIAEAAKNSVRYVKTVNDGNGLSGFSKSRYYARPFPEKGVDVIWNHMTRYRGGSLSRVMAQVSPYANGDYALVLFDDIFAYPETVEGATEEHMESVLFFYKQEVLEPARLSGGVLLAHETIDQVKEPRRVWIYNSGQRRVRRAPQVAYDGPGQAADGQRVADNLDIYNGSPDKYNWELVGKKKFIFPITVTNWPRPIWITTIFSRLGISTRATRAMSCIAYGLWKLLSRKVKGMFMPNEPFMSTKTPGRSPFRTCTTERVSCGELPKVTLCSTTITRFLVMQARHCMTC